MYLISKKFVNLYEEAKHLKNESIIFNIRSDSWTRTPIHWAAHSRHTKVVRELLEHGALPDPVDKNYLFTPLMLAAR